MKFVQRIIILGMLVSFVFSCSSSKTQTTATLLATPKPTNTEKPNSTVSSTATTTVSPTAVLETVQEIPLDYLLGLFNALDAARLAYEHDTAQCVSTEYSAYEDCVVWLDLCPGDIGCTDAVSLTQDVSGVSLDVSSSAGTVGDFQLNVHEGLVVPDAYRKLLMPDGNRVFECVTGYKVKVKLASIWNISAEIRDYLFREEGLYMFPPLGSGYRAWGTCAT